MSAPDARTALGKDVRVYGYDHGKARVMVKAGRDHLVLTPLNARRLGERLIEKANEVEEKGQ